MTSIRCGAARSTLVFAGLAIAMLAIGACSSSDDEKNKYVEEPVNTLYNRGMDALAERRYPAAAKAFDEVERQHPYSIWATKAQLMSAYALYQDNNYQDAINALTRFIQLHPGNRDIAYAYYLKALSYYEQVTDVERDQSNADQALTSLEELIRRYPDTPYAKDARRKIDLVRDHLAGKELEVGRFYETRGVYLAAINRFKTVVDKYQTTTQVPEALHRLVECYMALGVVDEAKKTAAVLGYNYPRSQWYVDSYQLVENVKVDRDTLEEKKTDDSFIAKTWNSLNIF
jgi:outer membrane protein assembly factor BamD